MQLAVGAAGLTETLASVLFEFDSYGSNRRPVRCRWSRVRPHRIFCDVHNMADRPGNALVGMMSHPEVCGLRARGRVAGPAARRRVRTA